MIWEAFCVFTYLREASDVCYVLLLYFTWLQKSNMQCSLPASRDLHIRQALVKRNKATQRWRQYGLQEPVVLKIEVM